MAGKGTMHWTFWLPLLAIPVIYLAIAFSLTLFEPDVDSNGSLNFDQLVATQTRSQAPQLQRLTARDGEILSYARYPASSDLVLILLHGSGYHGSYLAHLADKVAQAGTADV